MASKLHKFESLIKSARNTRFHFVWPLLLVRAKVKNHALGACNVRPNHSKEKNNSVREWFPPRAR